ncbi:MAG: copper chaperone PCu(A)C, partial [Acidisphaera sp.]|nr:copper chaperone PCu(A)C [Acidisphaera sp.]
MKALFLAAALAAAAAVPTAWSQPAPAVAAANPISAAHPWARPAPPALKTSAAYMELTTAGAADRLVGASTPVAGIAQI